MDNGKGLYCPSVWVVKKIKVKKRGGEKSVRLQEYVTLVRWQIKDHLFVFTDVIVDINKEK